MTTANFIAGMEGARSALWPTSNGIAQKAVSFSEIALGRGHAVPELPNRPSILRLLHAAVDCELECASNYMRHHKTADEVRDWVHSLRFLGYAGEKIAHSKRLGFRIVQLGGANIFAQKLHINTVLPAGDIVRPLHSMIAANIASEAKVIECYGRILMHINSLDLLTRTAVEGLLFEELEQMEELRAWLEASCQGTGASDCAGWGRHEFY